MLAEQIAALEAALVLLKRRADDGLIVAIARAVGGRCFTACELVEHAAITPTLAAALADAGVTSGRRLGKRLERLAGYTVAGVSIVRLGRERDGLVWTVVRDCADDLHTPPTADPARRA